MVKRDLEDLKARLAAAKKAMANQTTIYYNSHPYMITACILKFVNGDFLYSVELKDMTAYSCLVYTEINKIEFKE